MLLLEVDELVSLRRQDVPQQLVPDVYIDRLLRVHEVLVRPLDQLLLEIRLAADEVYVLQHAENNEDELQAQLQVLVCFVCFRSVFDTLPERLLPGDVRQIAFLGPSDFSFFEKEFGKGFSQVCGSSRYEGLVSCFNLEVCDVWVTLDLSEDIPKVVLLEVPIAFAFPARAHLPKRLPQWLVADEALAVERLEGSFDAFKGELQRVLALMHSITGARTLECLLKHSGAVLVEELAQFLLICLCKAFR